MELDIKNKLFIVIGATSGLGNGVAMNLLAEGSHIIAVARNQERLAELQNKFNDRVEIVAGDITRHETMIDALNKTGGRFLDGILVNSAGPPAKSFLETELQDWDDAYKSLLRWKIEITRLLLPVFRKQQYGRIVYIESSAVKQPVKNLVLSNSIRMSVVGMMKTLSQEIADEGITLNVLAPGYHDTAAAGRLFVKQSEIEGISINEARKKVEDDIGVGRLGDTGEFGMIAAWLLSPHSGYVTGQVISIDGGNIKGMM